MLGALLRIGQQLAFPARGLRSSVFPRGRVPAIGRSVTSRPSTRTITSGDAPTSVMVAEAQVKHVGRRIDRAQAAVDVERMHGQWRLEALRRNHLDNVARPRCTPWPRSPSPCSLAGLVGDDLARWRATVAGLRAWAGLPAPGRRAMISSIFRPARAVSRAGDANSFDRNIDDDASGSAARCRTPARCR